LQSDGSEAAPAATAKRVQIGAVRAIDSAAGEALNAVGFGIFQCLKVERPSIEGADGSRASQVDNRSMARCASSSASATPGHTPPDHGDGLGQGDPQPQFLPAIPEPQPRRRHHENQRHPFPRRQGRLIAMAF